MINIVPLPVLKDNYIWIIQNEQHEAIAIDPGVSDQLLDYINQNHLSLKSILFTHHHWDHTGGISDLREKTHAKVYGPSLQYQGTIDHPIEKMSLIKINGFPDIEIINTPGHTLDHVCYYLPQVESVFTGDTLFSAGCGRLFEGKAQDLYDSLQKLNQLPGTTQVYCGHEYTYQNLRFAKTLEPNNDKINHMIAIVRTKLEQLKPTLPSTIELEQEINPFLKTHSIKIQKAIKNKYNVQNVDNVTIFSKLRQWKDEFS